MNIGKPIRREIAIVDDDGSVRRAMVDLMNSLGFVAEPFARAEDFLASDSRHSSACLIADVQMPGMTGLELHDRLVTSGETIPTILITAYPDERVRSRALKAEIIRYLPKPFSESDLIRCINSALDNRKAS